jgi:hypothetical protein
VGLDNRTANGKSHPHSGSFRREEWLEYLIGILNSGAVIVDFDLQNLLDASGGYPDHLVTGNTFHCLHPVADEITQNLLNLNAIKRNRRYAFLEVNDHANPAARGFFGNEITNLSNHAIDGREVPLVYGLPKQCANATDHISGAIRIPNDAFDCPVRTVDVRRFSGQPALACMRIGNDSRERLIDLMRDGSRKFCQAGGLARAGEPLMREPQFLLRQNLSVNIQTDHIPLHNCSICITHWTSSGLDPAVFTVRAPQAVSPRIRLTGRQAMSILVLDACEVVRMNASVKRPAKPGLS